MDPEILVRGTGQARVLPDRALVRVTVDGEGGSREEAYRQAEGLAAQVDRVVAAHAGAVDRTVTTALSVQPKTRWRRGESVRTGWRASRTTSLDVTDFARLGDLFADLVGAGGAVAGPYWQVDPDNAVYDEARRRAGADARRRADA
ncbi:MAG TPA: SIMPL domain-containing protein, partial [Acidimicrobiales bacterium]